MFADSEMQRRNERFSLWLDENLGHKGKAEAFDQDDKLVQVRNAALDFGHKQLATQLKDAVGLAHKIHKVGAHQRKTKHPNVDRLVSQRHVGNVTGRNPVVGRHQIKRVHFLRYADIMQFEVCELVKQRS
jgi:hypothetical protein